MPSSERMSSVYERFRDYDKEFQTARSEIFFPTEIYKKILSCIKGAVLDIGTGEGNKLDNILRRCKPRQFTKVTAIDPSPLYLKAREKLKHYGNVEVQNSSFEDFRNKELFDTILLFDVIEHTDTPAAMLARITELLEPDGALILSTPNRPVYDFMEKLFKGKLDSTHVSEMSIEEFRTLACGFFGRIDITGILPIMKIGRKIPFILKAHRLFACPHFYNTIIAIMQYPIKK